MLLIQIWLSGRLRKKISQCSLLQPDNTCIVQVTNQEVVQKGGVISGHSARAAINACVETEAQKARRAAGMKYKQDAQQTTTKP